MEIWKDIPSYKNFYQVSNLGKVKSLERLVKGKHNLRINKEKILKNRIDMHGYCVSVLFNGYNKKTYKIHQLVAMAFLNHIPCGHKLIVNHIDFNKQNNHIDNLEIITQRENANQKHIKSSSKYVGVSKYKLNNKWIAKIDINGKRKHLGYFINEYDAHLAYEKALKSI